MRPTPAEGLTLAVCTYNAERRVERFVQPLLESLVGALSAAELLLVDDGSTDDTACIAAQLRPRIRLVRHNRNRGLPAARNTALLTAAHEWILFCDDDLVIDGAAMRALWEARDPGVCSVPEVRTPDGRLENAITTFVQLGEPRFRHHEAPVAGDLAYAMGACFLVHRRTALAIGGFDERLHLYYEDVDFGVQLYKHRNSVRMLPGVRVIHHAHGAAPERNDQRQLEEQVQRARWTFLLLRAKGVRVASVVLGGACRVTVRSLLERSARPGRAYLAVMGDLHRLTRPRAHFDARSRSPSTAGDVG